MGKLVKDVNDDSKNARKEYCKNKLKAEVEKAVRTTMIGAIASIEEKFGELWGLRQNRHLTQEEQEFADRFTELRRAILYNGNTQIKRITSSLDAYQVEFVGYSLQLVGPFALPVKKEGQ